MEYNESDGLRNLFLNLASTGDAEIRDILLSSKPDLNAQDNDGNTALHHAAIIGNSVGCDNMSLIEQLIDAGANQSIRNLKNETAEVQAGNSEDTTNFFPSHRARQAMLAVLNKGQK